MASFDAAIVGVIANEGGYVNNPADPGGETKYGISKRAYPALDIASLTLDDAKAIYHRDYWMFDGVSNQRIANKLLDMAVNMGKPEAIKLLQRALGFTEQDGVFGPHTLAALNATDPDHLVLRLRAHSAVFYAETVLNRPQDKQFLLGWMLRAVA